MNHADLVSSVAEDAELSKAEASRLVTTVFDAIRDALVQGDEVRVAGFGAFKVSQRAARQGRNPQTGETVKIAASKAARFSAAKAVKDALNSSKKKKAGASKR